MPDIMLPKPDLQIIFSRELCKIRNRYLQDALEKTFDNLDKSDLDKELYTFVPKHRLKELAKRGLRGELVYPVPCVLEANPFLLGYYRMLLGYSQKEFYTARCGISGFKSMESKGILTPKNRNALPELCRAMIGAAVILIDGTGIDRVSRELLDDLTLLTLGPQLRGGANVRKGTEGILSVFQAIHAIVEHAAIEATSGMIKIRNAAGRNVCITFAPDPDIVILEEMSPNKFRNTIAIEVKSGTDFSNIHNRIGEAEKSHQKAKAAGYVECWTVVNVDRFDPELAKRESPTTNMFFNLSDLEARIIRISRTGSFR